MSASTGFLWVWPRPPPRTLARRVHSLGFRYHIPKAAPFRRIFWVCVSRAWPESRDSESALQNTRQRLCPGCPGRLASWKGKTAGRLTSFFGASSPLSKSCDCHCCALGGAMALVKTKLERTKLLWWRELEVCRRGRELRPTSKLASRGCSVVERDRVAVGPRRAASAYQLKMVADTCFSRGSGPILWHGCKRG